MTYDERQIVLDKMEALITCLRDEDSPDADKGKVVWPPNENVSHEDALVTLFDIHDCDLDLTLYDETGNQLTDEWTVTFSGTASYPNSPCHYARKPLKALIEYELNLYIEEGTQDCRPAHLLKRLLLAFEEPC